MPLPTLSYRRTALRPAAVAALMLGASALPMASAQTTDADATQLPAVTISGRKSPAVSVSGWGDLPLSQVPLQASVFDAQTLRDQGIQSVRGLTQLDAAVGDSYNAAGYWDTLTLRG